MAKPAPHEASNAKAHARLSTMPWVSHQSARTFRQWATAAGVILSLAFVGMQIRESNRQARAAAYQAIGISTAEFHRGFTPRMNRLATESAYPDAVKRWTLEDWETVEE